MKLVRSLHRLHDGRGAGGRVLTIGAFDGLHRGHREILARASSEATRLRVPLSVMTFEPTPAEYFARSVPPARLTCFRERFEQLDSLGVDTLLCPRFAKISSLSHTAFFSEIVVGLLDVRHLVVGHDFRYGAGRMGTVETLAAAAADNGIGLTVVDAVFIDGDRVSSTRIRDCLVQGQLAAAGRMLGRDYSMSGRVVHGLGLGREFGFPTANVNLKRRKAPVDGIFAVEVDGIGRHVVDGVASVGNRPTVGGGKTLLEVFLFDFDQDIYGAYITVRFRQRLRSEEKFATIDEMKVQMRADAEAAKAALAGRIA